MKQFTTGFYHLRCSDGWTVIEVIDASGKYYAIGDRVKKRLADMVGCEIIGPIPDPPARTKIEYEAAL